MLEIRFPRSQKQVDDALTKPLPKARCLTLKTKIKVLPQPPKVCKGRLKCTALCKTYIITVQYVVQYNSSS